MVVRDRARGETAREEIARTARNGEVSLEICDLSNMGAIRQLARRLASSRPKLDVLVNNAGGVFSRRQTTEEGFERTMALDYLAPSPSRGSCSRSCSTARPRGS